MAWTKFADGQPIKAWGGYLIFEDRETAERETGRIVVPGSGGVEEIDDDVAREYQPWMQPRP